MDLRKRKKPLLVLISVVFLAVVFEGTARLFFLTADIFKRLQYVAEDTTWRRTWVRRHQKGMEIFYTFDMYDATKGWKAKPNLRDQTVFHDKELNTNAKGLRGKREYFYSKDPTRPRILILGDSFTFGDEVSDH